MSQEMRKVFLPAGNQIPLGGGGHQDVEAQGIRNLGCRWYDTYSPRGRTALRDDAELWQRRCARGRACKGPSFNQPLDGFRETPSGSEVDRRCACDDATSSGDTWSASREATYLARIIRPKNQPIERTGHLARHTTYWAIPDWWGRAQGLASSRDVVSARELYLKYPT